MGKMIEGWDNAPEAKLSKTYPKLVTIIYPYYDNPLALAKRVNAWAQLPLELRINLSAIIVDDGSPVSSAKQVLFNCPIPFKLRLFRIDVDRRWNWLAARNIGMSYANEGWCVCTDIDHIIPQETLENLVHENHEIDTIYRFNRMERGVKIHPHPNSWFMTREIFWKFGGYDEALSGYYGTDGEARRRWIKTAKVRTLKDYLIREEYVDDSSTMRYGRKESIDLRAQEIIKARPKDWKPRVLSFPYHEVKL